MSSKEIHKLAAIVFTDLVGFTKIMDKNEQAGLDLLEKQRLLFLPIIETYKGTMLKEIGDGMLLMFDSSLSAVECAITIQKEATNNNLLLRIGIHIGDIVVKKNDIFGSGVNTASRIESLTKAGEICISEDVWRLIRNRNDLFAESIGKRELKGIKHPIEVFRLTEKKLGDQNIKIPFLKKLWNRRVPQIIAIYLGVCWVVVEFVSSLLVDRFFQSPYLIEFSIVTLLSLLPSILLLAYFHGKPGKNEWTKFEKIGIPINIILVAFVLFLTFHDKDLGAIAETVTLENEEGEQVERVIPKSGFIKSVGIFFFENISGDSSLDWLQYGFSDLLDYDLDPEIFIYSGNRYLYNDVMIQAGFDKGVGAPLTVKRNIVKSFTKDYFVTGSFDKSRNNYQLIISLYKTDNGKLISKKEYIGSNIFELIDSVTLNLKHDLKLPESHIEEAIDLPLTETMTNSLEALKQYVLGRNYITLENDWISAQKYLERSIIIDSTFAIAYDRIGLVYNMLNLDYKANEALENLIKYIYKLPEDRRFKSKYKFFKYIDKDIEKAVSTLKLWAGLFPNESKVHVYLGKEYIWANNIDAAIMEFKIASELISDYSMLDDIGELYREIGDFDNALKYFKKYNIINHDNYYSYINIANLYLEYGFHIEAHEYIYNASIVDPQNILTFLKLAEIKKCSGKKTDTSELYRKALKKAKTHKDKSKIYYYMQSFYEYTGNLDKSIEYMNLRFKEEEEFLPIYKVLRRKIEWLYLYAKADKACLALEILDNIKKNHGDLLNKTTCFGYLDIYLELKDIENIRKSIKEVESYIQTVGSEKDREIIYYAQGKICEINFEYEKAIKNYQKQSEYDLSSTDIPLYKLLISSNFSLTI